MVPGALLMTKEGEGTGQKVVRDMAKREETASSIVKTGDRTLDNSAGVILIQKERKNV